MQKILVIGAGFAGSTFARLAADAGHEVTVMDRRDHVGGNAYDHLDEHGVLIHPYGPHIFHTNSKKVMEFLSRFTDWRFYEHRVLSSVEGELYPIPVNRTTINKLYGLDLDEEGVAKYLESVAIPCDAIRTSEDVVLGCVGKDLGDKFFSGYTEKQWGLKLRDLSAGVAARIPTRTNDDDRYFTDTYQFMPLHGYGAMFERMLDHPRITVRLGESHEVRRDAAEDRLIVYTGPIDAYFGYCLGKLPYRSLDFEHVHLKNVNRFQDVGTINYPNDHDYTRITEFKHLTGQELDGTSIVREYPRAEGDPYYPIPRSENEVLYKKYAEMAKGEKGVIFVGRLAQYRYYNMDQVVAASMSAYESHFARESN